MIDPDVRVETARRHDVPRIEVISGSATLPAHPATIFEVVLIAGDIAAASLTVTGGSADEPLVQLDAPPGGVARFVPAAPAVIRDPLQIRISGADAVGSIAYR